MFLRDGTRTFSHDKIEINGTIKAIGAEEFPIRFISTDQNEGDWQGIILYGHNNVLKHVQISYTGKTPIDSEEKKAAIFLNNSASLEISNSTINKSAGWCIWLENKSSLVDSNLILECSLGEINL